MTDHTDLAPDVQRSRRIIRVVQTLGLILGGAYLILAYGRWTANVDYAWISGLSALLGIAAAVLATVRARLAYWVFLGAYFVALIDLTLYFHALLFLGSFMILGAMAAINTPDDEDALTIRRIMEGD